MAESKKTSLAEFVAKMLGLPKKAQRYADARKKKP